MTEVLEHRDGVVRLEEIGEGRRRITVERPAGGFVGRRRIETAYPPELIRSLLRLKGPAHLCGDILRAEDPGFTERRLRWEVLSYVDESEFAGRRVLDFGSGTGASSIVLARLLPDVAEIVGVELRSGAVDLARERARFHGADGTVRFLASPDASSLPRDVGEFDHILLSAVYEHLLPDERRTLLPLLWRHLHNGGVMFLNQTPHRWSLVEGHTTGLALINYMPDRLALSYARRFSRRVSPDAAWTSLLRRGVRGGSEREILDILTSAGGAARMLSPARAGVTDRIELWRLSGKGRRPQTKRLLAGGLRAVRIATGATLTPALALAIEKRG